MLTDAKGQDLQDGDEVMLPCKVFTQNDDGTIGVFPSADRPDTQALAGMNVHPRQVLRAREGDDLSHRIVVDGDISIIAPK